jgi:hypothetical protein
VTTPARPANSSFRRRRGPIDSWRADVRYSTVNAPRAADAASEVIVARPGVRSDVPLVGRADRGALASPNARARPSLSSSCEVRETGHDAAREAVEDTIALPRWFAPAALALGALTAIAVLAWSLVFRETPDTTGRETCRVQAARAWPDDHREREAAFNECLRALP